MSVANLLFRSQSSADISDLRNPALWLVNAMGGRQSSSGQTVTPESAMTLSVVYACLRNLADDIGTMPIKVYEADEDGGKEEQRDNPVYKLVHDTPNHEMNPADFWGTLIHWAAGWGNGIAEIELSGRGEPLAMHPIHPSRVELKRDRDSDRLFYDIKTDSQGMKQLTPDRVYHLKGFGPGLWGYSAIAFGAESMGLALALQEFGSSFFANGINSNGVISVPEELDPGAMENLRGELAEAYSGADNAYKPLIMYGGMEWKTISVPPEQAQFLESRRFSVEDTARWFRMPLPMIGHLEEAHYNNVESLDLDYAKHTLGGWTIRIAQEIKRKLLGDGNLFAEHVMEALLRGDSTAQSAFNTANFRLGAINRNEIRKALNMNPVEGGDVYYVEHNLQPVGADGKPDTPDPPPMLSPSGDGDDEGDEDAASPPPFGGRQKRENAKRAVMPIFVDGFERVIRMESDRVKRNFAKADWLRSFYGSHAKFVTASLSAPAKTLAVLVCEPGAETLAEAIAVERVECYAVDWCEAAWDSLEGHADADALLEQWSKTRAASGASGLVELVAAAVTECEQ